LLLAGIRRVDEKLTAKIESLKKTIPLGSCLAVLEAEFKRLKKWRSI